MAAALLPHVLDALQVALWLSLPLLAVAWLAGLLSSAVGSLTRLGDATSASVPRQLAVALCAWALAGWLGGSLRALTERLWAGLESVGGG